MYRHASKQAPNSSWMDIETARGDFQTLYQREEKNPLDLNLATYANPSKVNNDIPFQVEVESAVRRLCLHREGGHTHLCVEHFKQW